MPRTSKLTCNVDSDCNGEGKCVQSSSDGSYYCDCTIGYIEPHCKNRDPCVLEGNIACQNGSTCKRINNFDYECKCRVPYGGEFCEMYDLCEVDVDECIEDLNRADPSDPFCYPCIPEATCHQVSKRNYVCICPDGFNHSSCYVYPETRGSPNLEEPENTDFWNPIIPTIAITSCLLYFLVLIIILLCYRKRKEFHPRLIVCCDIHKFDELSYYLVSVETGRQWMAGTKCNVYCFLCGENGQAGPYPLYDLNLSEVYALQRCQEDNFLFAHTMDLGRIEKIVLWYDNRAHNSSWFCEKITVRNIKTEENWHFYTSSWLSSERKRRHEFLTATKEYVKYRGTVTINCPHYCYQVARNHSYISPFIYPTPDRITLMFAEWMSYMLILIALYGFITRADADINSTGIYILTYIVLENGSLAAISCFWIALTCALLLMAFTKVKSIPTLLVWHNKPGMSEYELGVKKEPSTLTNRLKEPKFTDVATNTDFDDMPYSLPAVPEPAHTTVSDLSQNLFRIPSTDIVKTEKWVQDSIEKSPHSKEVDETLVHDYTVSHEHINVPETVLDYGLIGGLTDGRQQEPNRFVYSANSNEDSRILRTHIEDDIRDIYDETIPLSESETRQNDTLPLGGSNSTITPPVTKLFFRHPQPEEVSSFSKSPLQLAAGDFSREQDLKVIGKRRKVYCELCEMATDSCWNLMVKISVIIGWILCLCLILAATVICCIYGGRYGYQRTYDWIISLVICWTENFLLYQFLKILLIVIIITILIKLQRLPNVEYEKISERFQVYYVNGLTVLPEKDALKFVWYLPKYWIPAPHVKIDFSKTSSNTSIQK